MTPVGLPRYLDAMSPRELLDYLNTQIPLSAAMQVAVAGCDARQVRLTAPLAPNRNHRDTAFGGSLVSLAMLAGWSLLYLALREAKREARLVIQRGQAEFLRPAHGELTAVCCLPAIDWPRFVQTLDRRARARIHLDSQVRCGTQPVLALRGAYVAALEARK